MQQHKKYLSLPTLLTLGAATFSLLMLAATPIWAQVTFNPPKDLAPKKSTGGASRDASICSADISTSNAASVTPLLPKTNIGLTLTQRPTVLVYVPQTKAKKAMFTLQDEQGKQYYQTTFPVPRQHGVMAVKLPSSVPALTTGKNYQWSLVMICTQELEPDSPWVSGWIRRVESQRSLNNQASLAVATKLARMGIWYDSLATLAELKRKQPNNPSVSASWQELLKSVDLNAIANEPLIN
ncbi:DUF928 domain-containing protein [Nostoc sp. FACHB-110]|uniref:DUF928 domain-containing protein n=1 Tax=Nostoc sp. FACHB-110 TaxID=2692834 RepID=UPI001688E9B3|nr:DUF928 domain-containing protein [Nostoc sp. FACHB-110]MBD2436314.1 DUF928 domain-containing protein [Nostoc sp. FACHB-110]